jgi:hypothetical protein
MLQGTPHAPSSKAVGRFPTLFFTYTACFLYHYRHNPQPAEERIDDAAEHLNATRKRMEAIKTKLMQLQSATSDGTMQGGRFDHATQQSQHDQEQIARVEEERQKKADESRRTCERCIRAFNLNPRKGIALIKEFCVTAAGDIDPLVSSETAALGQSALPKTYPTLGAFLYENAANLNKSKLGQWLGEATAENARALADFARAFGEQSFRGETLEVGLRAFCRRVKLPAESKKLDRIMDAFAGAYVSEQQGNGYTGSRIATDSAGAPFIFSSTDAVHILAFSCVTLNQDTHAATLASLEVSNYNNNNPPSRPSSTEESFIANHRGIDNGSDLPRGLLEGLYRSIVSNPIVTPLNEAKDHADLTASGENGEGSGNGAETGVSGGAILFTHPLRQGWLKKQGGSKSKSWARRWFVVCDATLFYFAAEGDIGQPKGCFPLGDLVATAEKKQIQLAPKSGKDYLKSAKFDRRGEMVVGNHRTLTLSAASEKEAVSWIEALNAAALETMYQATAAAVATKDPKVDTATVM